MGNTKTYYIEGELLPNTTIEKFREVVYDSFHSTYCAAEIVDESGYLNAGVGGEGPYVVAAIHSYSTVGDQGPEKLAETCFQNLIMHRLDSDWADVWVAYWERKNGPYKSTVLQWRTHSDKWEELNPEKARLIKAAPKLLAVCKLALGAFERNNCIDWNELERAIAEAEGEEN